MTTPRSTVVASLIVSALSVVALEGCRADAPGAEQPPDGWRGTVLEAPQPKVDFTLTTTEGEAFQFVPETDGDVTLLFFGYTSCPDICPVHLANIAAVLNDFSYELRERISVVFVSTDPQRDTPERIRSWLDGFDRSFVGLRGAIEDVNAIERSFGLPPSFIDDQEPTQDYLVGHAAQVLAFTTDGLAHLVYPFGIRQEDWAHDLPRLVRTGFLAEED